jgi:hypothetical protein
MVSWEINNLRKRALRIAHEIQIANLHVLLETPDLIRDQW